MWCKADGEKEDGGPNGDFGIEGNNGSDGKDKWSEMVWRVLRRNDGHVLRKALEFCEGQEEARTTKEDVEDASGEGEKECWFGEGGCLESSKMESWRDCR